MNGIAIIVAGGSGRRLGGDVPKQFLLLNGRPLLMRTLEVFSKVNQINQIRVVLPENHFDTWQNLCREYLFEIRHQVVAGGSERFFSVKNALADINPGDIIAIHDGVRPLASVALIERALAEGNKNGAAVPVMPVADSLRQKSDVGYVPAERGKFVTVQTPQVFRADVLLKAYEQPYLPSFTDDASVVEQAGYSVSVFEGERFNFKITTKEDFLLAFSLLKMQETGRSNGNPDGNS